MARTSRAGSATPTAPASNGLDGLNQSLWATADSLRGHLDAADYKHVVLGLIFLKYISDAFASSFAEYRCGRWQFANQPGDDASPTWTGAG